MRRQKNESKKARLKEAIATRRQTVRRESETVAKLSRENTKVCV